MNLAVSSELTFMKWHISFYSYSYDGGLPQNFILEVTSLTTPLGKVAKHEVFMIDNGISTMNDQVSDLN